MIKKYSFVYKEYVEKANKDKERYEQEMAEYKKGKVLVAYIG